MNSISQSLVKKISLIGIVITLSMLAVSAYAWFQLPAGAQIPAHWNAAGEVDRYAGKIEGLLFLPAISVGLFLLLALIPKIEPRKLNMQQSAKAYTAVAVIAGLIMMLIHVMTVATALGFKVAFAAVLTAAVGLLFIVMGNVMGKIRSNFMFGVRTPCQPYGRQVAHGFGVTHARTRLYGHYRPANDLRRRRSPAGNRDLVMRLFPKNATRINK